jgi:arsenate reductase
MAEGFLKSFDNNLEVYSAGTGPSDKVHPKAVEVMREEGIDLKKNYPKNVDQFLDMHFNYVITVCDNARETCPIFTGKVDTNLHIGFDDPADATGSEDEVIAVFRRVRDEIKRDFWDFYISNIKNA